MVGEDDPVEAVDEKQVEREQEINQNLRAARSKNPMVKGKALKRLGELQAGTQVLLDGLSDPAAVVRVEAAHGLGHLTIENLGTDVIESLLAAIDDPSDKVCAAAINSLGKLGVEQAREQIMPFLKDGNAQLVSAAIRALSRLGPPEIGEQLAGFLESEHPLLQSEAARAMGVLRYSQANARLLALLQELAQPGAYVTGALLGNLIYALGVLKVREAIPLLIELAQNQVGMRSRAVQALIEMNATEAVPLLAHMLADPGESIRESLIRLLVVTRYSGAPLLLRPMLKDANGRIRRRALLAVTELGDASAIHIIREMSRQDSNPFLRATAIASLVKLLGAEAIPDLVALASDTNVKVRTSVAYQLGGMADLPAEALAALSQLASDAAPEVQLAAQEALPGRDETPLRLAQAAAVPARVVVFPQEMQDQAEFLLNALRQWQDHLTKAFRPELLEKLAPIDQALTSLIGELERLEKPRS